MTPIQYAFLKREVANRERTFWIQHKSRLWFGRERARKIDKAEDDWLFWDGWLHTLGFHSDPNRSWKRTFGLEEEDE